MKRVNDSRSWASPREEKRGKEVFVQLFWFGWAYSELLMQKQQICLLFDAPVLVIKLLWHRERTYMLALAHNQLRRIGFFFSPDWTQALGCTKSRQC